MITVDVQIHDIIMRVPVNVGRDSITKSQWGVKYEYTTFKKAMLLIGASQSDNMSVYAMSIYSDYIHIRNPTNAHGTNIKDSIFSGDLLVFSGHWEDLDYKVRDGVV